MATVDQLKRAAREISRNLTEAIACYAVFLPTARDTELIARVNAGAVNLGFNVISESLHKAVIMALCRLWDRRADTASLPWLDREMRKSATLRALDDDVGEIDREELRRWHTEVQNTLRMEELKALQGARGRAIAHTANPSRLYQGRSRRAVYGDERRVLEATVPVVDMLNSFVAYAPQPPYLELRRRWSDASGLFWRSGPGA